LKLFGQGAGRSLSLTNVGETQALDLWKTTIAVSLYQFRYLTTKDPERDRRFIYNPNRNQVIIAGF